MESIDYMFIYNEKPHVAHINSDRIEEVESFNDTHITLKSGRGYWFDELSFPENQIQHNFYTAKAWKRKCYLDIIL